MTRTHFIVTVFTFLLVSQWIWCHFLAYPIALERKLKQGKSWIYIPLGWRGLRKTLIRFISRLIPLALGLAGAALLSHYTRKGQMEWLLAFSFATTVLGYWLHRYWINVRYFQQEDAYFHLHDQLKIKLSSEGKNMADTAFRSLAVFRHQTLLRSADKEGRLNTTLGKLARQSRSKKTQGVLNVPLEAGA